MALFDFFGTTKKAQVAEATKIFEIRCELHPMRLEANKNDFVDVELEVTNLMSSESLTSILIKVPKPLGLDASAFSNEKEIRLGPLAPNTKTLKKIRVYSTQRADKGTYPIAIHAISHYHDYSHVLNEAKKSVPLRLV